MMKIRMIIPVLLAVVAMTGLGCKRTQVTFVNTTGEPLELYVHGPGLNIGYLGVLPPSGQIRTKIEVWEGWLPETYTWVAGKGVHTGNFSLTKDSNPKIWVTIPMGAAPISDPGWRHAEGTRMTGDPARIVIQP